MGWASAISGLARKAAHPAAIGRGRSGGRADTDRTVEQRLVDAIRQIESVTAGIGRDFEIMSHAERRRCASLLADFMRAARAAIDPLLFPPLAHGPNLGFDWLKAEGHRQTLTFYADIWEIVFDEIYKVGKLNLRLLDVGAGCGIGAQLLGILLRNAFGFTIEITASDGLDNFEPYARAHFDRVTFVAEALQDINEKFDIVLCSHLIEHFPDPFPFIEELRKRASHAVIVYAPFEEETLIDGHFYSFGEADLARMAARSHKIITSKAWPGRCFVAVLDGSGP